MIAVWNMIPVAIYERWYKGREAFLHPALTYKHLNCGDSGLAIPVRGKSGMIAITRPKKQGSITSKAVIMIPFGSAI